MKPKIVKKTRGWAVIAPKKTLAAHWVEVSLVRGNLPEVTRGEKLVRVTITED